MERTEFSHVQIPIDPETEWVRPGTTVFKKNFETAKSQLSTYRKNIKRVHVNHRRLVKHGGVFAAASELLVSGIDRHQKRINDELLQTKKEEAIWERTLADYFRKKNSKNNSNQSDPVVNPVTTTTNALESQAIAQLASLGKEKSRPTETKALDVQEIIPEIDQPSEFGGPYDVLTFIYSASEEMIRTCEDREIVEDAIRTIVEKETAKQNRDAVEMIINNIASTDPEQTYQRYRKTVAGGPYQGYRVVGRGSHIRVLFATTEDNDLGKNLFIRIAPYKKVYGTKGYKH